MGVSGLITLNTHAVLSWLECVHSRLQSSCPCRRQTSNLPVRVTELGWLKIALQLNVRVLLLRNDSGILPDFVIKTNEVVYDRVSVVLKVDTRVRAGMPLRMRSTHTKVRSEGLSLLKAGLLGLYLV